MTISSKVIQISQIMNIISTRNLLELYLPQQFSFHPSHHTCCMTQILKFLLNKALILKFKVKFTKQTSLLLTPKIIICVVREGLIRKRKCELSHFCFRPPPLKSVKLKKIFFHTSAKIYFGKKNIFFHL